MSYDSEIEEVEVYDNNELEEEKEFDNNWNNLEKLRENFEKECPYGLFTCLSIPDFEKLLNGTYKPKYNYFTEKTDKKEDSPSCVQYKYQPKTQAEMIKEKKEMITFGYEKLPCNNCKICKRGKNIRNQRRRRVCRNRGQIISKPLYPKLHKVKIQMLKPTKPIKTKFEEYNEQRKEKEKNTGKIWGEIKQLNPNLNLNMKKNKEEETRKKEEKEKERLRLIKVEQEKIKQEREYKEAEEKRRYFRQREQKYNKYNKKQTRTRKTSGRFSNF